MSIMGGHRVTPTFMWETFLRKHGFRTFEEIVEDVEERFGSDEAPRVDEGFARAIEGDRKRQVGVAGVNYLAEPSLLVLPEPLFLDAVEYGFREGLYPAQWDAPAREINELLERRGVFFRFSEVGSAEWVGDPGAYPEIIAPALAALQDSRLAGARNEFEAGLAHLRQGGAKDKRMRSRRAVRLSRAR
jgi:hypothetical protein